MKILYYTWNENPALDAISCMRDLDHQVDVLGLKIANYTHDEKFNCILTDAISYPAQSMTVRKSLKLTSDKYDCVYSYNYFPTISEVCQNLGTPYISWVYDSPHYTLDSLTINNSCNHIYLFDYALYEFYHSLGVNTVYYMPLGYYSKRIHALVQNSHSGISSIIPTSYKHDISFIGSLYNDNYNFFDQIKDLPDSLRGYTDAIIESQLLIYGLDLIGTTFDDNKCLELSKYAVASLGEGYRDSEFEIFKNMIRRKATAIERPRLLKALSESFDVSLFSGAPPVDIPRIKFMGYAESLTQMPTVFNTSKINLNISLRTIQTGIPLRVIDILGAGGFCLTNYQAELSEYFVNGQDIVWFDSVEDLLDKANYYLNPGHEDIRRQIAINGHNIAAQMFSLENLLPQVLQL